MPLDADANADEDFDLDNDSTPRRRHSPVLNRQGRPGKSSTFSNPLVKKNRPRTPPDHPRRNKFTARHPFQESPSSRRSMILEKHTYATLPGAHYDTGRYDHRDLCDGGRPSLRENPPAVHIPLGPIGTLRDANGHLYSVVSTTANMPANRSHLSLPEGRLSESTPATPHVPAPNQSRAESLLSINLPSEKDAKRK